MQARNWFAKSCFQSMQLDILELGENQIGEQFYEYYSNPGIIRSISDICCREMGCMRNKVLTTVNPNYKVA